MSLLDLCLDWAYLRKIVAQCKKEMNFGYWKIGLFSHLGGWWIVCAEEQIPQDVNIKHSAKIREIQRYLAS